MYSTIELINKIKNENSNEALKELVANYSGSCAIVARNYRNFTKDIYGFTDLMNDRFSVIYEAAKRFDPTRNISFHTVVHSYMKNHCLSKLDFAKEEEINFEPQLASAVYEKKSENDDFPFRRFDFQDVWKILDNLEDTRIAKIFKLRYNSGLGWRVIGKEMGLSHEMVRKIHNKELEKLKNQLK